MQKIVPLYSTWPSALAIAAAEHGRRVYYATLADLITSVEEAQAAGRLQQRLKVPTHHALLVVDEIGYLLVNRTGAMHFFQLMARRYEAASTVLISSKGLEDWGEIFGDDVMAAALIGRLLHCVFRRKPAADSGPSRPRIPVDSGHRFRSKPATDSGDSGRPFRQNPATP